MKKLALTLALSLALLTSCGTSQNDNQTTISSNEEILSATITVKDEEEIVSEKEVEFNEGDILQDVMKDNFELSEEGGFITSIEEIKQSETDNKWWVFTANDEMVNVGANEYILEDDDDIVWTLTQF